MSYKSTLDCISDLKSSDIIEINQEIDPDLDIATLTRLIYKVRGPALLFNNVKNCKYSVCSNLFGTLDRSLYIFRHSFNNVKNAIEFKANPVDYIKNPYNFAKFPSLCKTAIHSLCKKISANSAPVLKNKISISQLPQLKSWPLDGGAFITLPQVMSFPEKNSSIFKANLGMYRVQISGGDYEYNKEVGLHYQIRRTIGIHHKNAIEKNYKFKVAIHIGGPPSHTIAAVMPMPDNLSELIFAGMLAKKRVRWCEYDGYKVLADADFCILGYVQNNDLKPEGPFGDHLGYYSLKHPFPYLKIEHVFCRNKAVYPITVVGRPPQEDSTFGVIIHKLTSTMVPQSLPGIKEINAVDQAGVHPLLIAIGSENYTPYIDKNNQIPSETITQAMSILGFNQCSLAKYLFIATQNSDTTLSTNELKNYFTYVLERIELPRDLLILSRTTIDTLDYSSGDFNYGSKAIFLCTGIKKRELSTDLTAFKKLKHSSVCASIIPGIVAINLNNNNQDDDHILLQQMIDSLDLSLCNETVMVVICDDPEYMASNFDNFLWITFTMSNPADNIHGKNSRFVRKHFSFDGPVFIDARTKNHHTQKLTEDESSVERVNKIIDKNKRLSDLLK